MAQNTEYLNKVNDMEMVNEYVGHMNQSQKIKYLQRLKDENNDLKKLVSKLQLEV
jgi:hypothetical protein